MFVKELRSWLRDPVRLQSLVVAPAFALMTCVLPLFFDSTAFLAFIGSLTALMGAVMSANLYGQDGTALWLTLLTPGSERPDVRGRQLAWLALFGPMTIVLTVAGIVASGEPGLRPWALAASAALLGGGAGLLPALADDQLVPGPDPREHKDAPLDHGDLTGQAFVMMFLTIGTALPALGTVIVGGTLDKEALRWLGVLSGVLAYVLLGRTAYRGLAWRGPELLFLMQAGKGAPPPARRERFGYRSDAEVQAPLAECERLGRLHRFVPAGPGADIDEGVRRCGAQVWFLPLYMPAPWQWPTIAFMFLLGDRGVHAGLARLRHRGPCACDDGAARAPR